MASSSSPLVQVSEEEEEEEENLDAHGAAESRAPPHRLHLFQTLQEDRQRASSLPAGGGGNDNDKNPDAAFYASYHDYCTAKISRISHRRSVRSALVRSHKYQTAAEAASAQSAAVAAASRAEEASPDANPESVALAPLLKKKEEKAKASQKKNKKKHAYCSRDLSTVVHEDTLWYLAYQAERAWAHACEIQRGTTPAATKAASLQNNDGTTPPPRGGRHKQHAIRRLKRAAMWSERLAMMAAEQFHVDDASLQECRSYAAYMAGNLALERKRYRDALAHYRRSRSLLIELVATTPTSSGDGEATEAANVADLALRDVWTTRADALLQPLIRYCEYESRASAADHDDDDDDDDDAVDSHASPTASSSQTEKTVVRGEILLTFRGRTVALDSYQELAVLYLKLEPQLAGGPEQEGCSSGWDEDAFLALSNDLDAALRLVQAEIKRYEPLPDGPAVAAKRADLNAVRQCLEYHKLSGWRRQQERRLAAAAAAEAPNSDDQQGASSSEADLLYLYDTLLQNAVATSELQQQQQSGDGYSAADDPLWLETQAHALRFRAFRCYYLARHYEENPMQDDNDVGGGCGSSDGLSRATALFRQADKLAIRAIEEADACDRMESHVEALKELSVRVQAALCRVEALRYLEESGAHAVVSTRRPLWMRLNDWDHGAGSHVVGPGRPENPPTVVFADNPPLMIPVPCKPSFYDVAWQHLPRDDDAAQEIGSFLAAREPKRGFLEWVRGGLKG